MRPRVLWVNLKSCQIPSLFHCHCQWLRASKHMKVSWPDQQLGLFLGHWETTFRSEEVMKWPGWRCVKISFAFGWMCAFVRFAFFWAFFYRVSACHALCEIHVPFCNVNDHTATYYCVKHHIMVVTLNPERFLDFPLTETKLCPNLVRPAPWSMEMMCSVLLIECKVYKIFLHGQPQQK